MHQQQVHREEAGGAVVGGPLRGDHHLRGPALPPPNLLPARRHALPRRRHHRARGADVVRVNSAAVQPAAPAPTTDESYAYIVGICR